jgi:hypothetical protein
VFKQKKTLNMCQKNIKSHRILFWKQLPEGWRIKFRIERSNSVWILVFILCAKFFQRFQGSRLGASLQRQASWGRQERTATSTILAANAFANFWIKSSNFAASCTFESGANNYARFWQYYLATPASWKTSLQLEATATMRVSLDQ